MVERFAFVLRLLAGTFLALGAIAIVTFAWPFTARSAEWLWEWLGHRLLVVPAALLNVDAMSWASDHAHGLPFLNLRGIVAIYVLPALLLAWAARWAVQLFADRRAESGTSSPDDAEPLVGDVKLPDPEPGRNIVLCCDGTSNEFCKNNTNVVKLFEMLDRDPNKRQLSFYDPGVGTFSAKGALLPITKRITRWLGLAFGMGLVDNLEDGYTYLMNHWKPGDNIYIFGFSRGAYTARAIAAMVHKVGLLEPGNEHFVPYASKIFRTTKDPKVYQEFKHTFGRPCKVRFLGLWDTVKSLGWIWSRTTWPFTMNNDDVDIVRHAVAIDEKRAFFRQNLWGRGGSKQSIKQVWFAGAHSDVGGSYPERESGLSQIALGWMVREAERAGLLTDATAKAAILAPRTLNPQDTIHNSLKWYWWPAEFFPKLNDFKVSTKYLTGIRLFAPNVPPRRDPRLSGAKDDCPQVQARTAADGLQSGEVGGR
jgi:hypothetical protein